MVSVRAQGTGQAKAEITSFEVTRNAKGAFDLVARFHNTGNASFVPQVTFTIRDETNAIVGKIRAPDLPPFVQAGGEGMVSDEWSRVLESGEYTVELTLRFDPDEPLLVRRAQFTVPAPDAAPVATTAEG